jgi:hypothetical protein
MPRRKIDMPEDAKEPVYVWAFESSKARGGQIIYYETRLLPNGTLSCNCPGWLFKKTGENRSCKHTKRVEGEVAGIMKKFKKGEALPQLEAIGNAVTGGREAPSQSASKIRHGRVIEI